MKEHEFACFVEKTGLESDQIISFDLLQGPPQKSDIKYMDAIMVGGSGEFDVSKENLPFYFDFIEFLNASVSRGTPMFASCFGYQCLVMALGGRIFRDENATEVGVYPLQLTQEGKKDPLFEAFPETFLGCMGHKDRTIEQPGGIPNLVSSDLCPFQALRIPGKPIWATQFHPELDQKTNLDRFNHYMKEYSVNMDEKGVQETLARYSMDVKDTPRLLPRFLELVFG